MPKALITGITGMDGSHMADFLLTKDYQVFGLERLKASDNRQNIAHIEDRVEIVKGDLADSSSLYHVLEQVQPDEIYNFAAQSFVGDSWNLAEHTVNITALGVLRLFEAARVVVPQVRIVQASSSEMFGNQETVIANERCRFNPQNPYGVAKLFGHHVVQTHRNKYNMFACSSIMFNHESPRRGSQFVTRKITKAVASISKGLQDTVALGNLTPRRDWGYAPEYVEGMWRMATADAPDDYVLSTGVSSSVKEFVQKSFQAVGITDWNKYVTVDPRFVRSVEVNYLRGDSTKAKDLLGWESKTNLDTIVKIMVESDIKQLGGDHV